MSRKISLKKKLFIVGLVVLVLAIGVGIFVFARNDRNPQTSQENTQPTPQKEDDQEPEQPAESPQETALPGSSSYDISSPSSLTVIINKNRPLPADYVPNDLVVPAVRLRLASSQEQMKFRRAASNQLKEMFDAATADGVTLVFGSGYRSYALQKQFYESYVARDGQAAADRYSARPGTSEHQTGLSFDATSPDQTCHLEICFENTSQGQ